LKTAMGLGIAGLAVVGGAVSSLRVGGTAKRDGHPDLVTILSIDGDFAVVVVEDGEPSTVPLSALSPVHDLLQPQAVKRLSSLVDAYLSALPLYMQCAKLEPPLTHPKVLVSEETEVVVESEHPYLNDTNKMYTISIPGASSIKLQFDSRSRTEDNYDYVTLYKDAAKSAWIGPKEKFCGTSFGTDSFEVAQDQVFVWFHSDGSNNDWGFRLVASGVTVVDRTPPDSQPSVLSILFSQVRHSVLKAVLSLSSTGALGSVPRDLLSSTLASTLATASAPQPKLAITGGSRRSEKTFESIHPYLDNMHETIDFSCPWADTLTIYFDPQTITEQTHDYICFFKDSSHTSYYGNERYSGPSANWPSQSAPLIIKGNSFAGIFHTDGSNTGWGYKFTVVATVDSSGSATLSTAELETASAAVNDVVLYGAKLPAEVDPTLFTSHEPPASASLVDPAFAKYANASEASLGALDHEEAKGEGPVSEYVTLDLRFDPSQINNCVLEDGDQQARSSGTGYALGR